MQVLCLRINSLHNYLTEGSTEPNVFMAHNDSGRYESRFSTVRIDDSPAMMLKGMSGSTLGVWVAHGEGKK